MIEKRDVGIGCVLGLLLLTGCSQKTMLFNGKNLDGWKPFLKDLSKDPATVWRIQDGVIHCQGQPFGYIRTTESYSDYKLHVEWRWVAKPTNSGVLLHMTGQDKVWPRSVEAQLRSGDAGDIILIGKDLSLTRDDKTYKVKNKYQSIKKMEKCSEKQPGQWNSYDILCKGNTVQLVVNGVVQNKGSHSDLTSGPICLQSEGSPIEFRNVYLIPLRQR